MAGILLKQVEKRYGKQQHYSVKDFNLDIGDSEFLVLVGPSGCGKSTTLRMIAGLEDITSGEIYIGDRKVNHLPPRERDIAMVFQNYALYPNMNVYENIAFGLRLRKMPKHEMDLAVKKAMRILEISNFQDRKPREMSGGQRQRVALGRAIVRNPQVFLMDEPLSNLDAKLRTQMRTEIIQLHKQLGVTTVYVTHDQVEAMTMGHRIVVMKDGLIQQVDTPQQVYNKPANQFVASFIGTPPINFISGKLVEVGTGRLQFRTSRFHLPVASEHVPVLQAQGKAGRNVTLAIRSEHLYLEPGQLELWADSQIKGIQRIGELMGADMHLYLDIAQDKLLIARASAGHHFEQDEPLQIAFNMTKALYFDHDSGVSLLHGPAGKKER